MSEERIVREFPVELTEGDGRTIDARIVPYNKPTRVRDGSGQVLPVMASGAFEKQTRAADKVKVLLNFEHQQGLGGSSARAPRSRTGATRCTAPSACSRPGW